MIYFDNAATTKPLAGALEAGRIYNEEYFYNASALYKPGRDVFARLGEARNSIARAVATAGHEVLFTSGGSESDNAAIFGAARRGNAVTTSGEHAAVYKSFIELKNRGVEPRFAPLLPGGGADVSALLALVDEETSLVSVVHVNNETGAVNDVAAIAAAVKKKNPRALFHSDGVQAFGKIPFRLTDDIDFYAVSAHKIGGLKGTGALIKRKKTPLQPLIFGGGQESGYRSGTENVFGIKAFAYAASARCEKIDENFSRAAQVRKAVAENLDPALFEILSPEGGSPSLLSVSARGVRGEVLQHMLENEGFIVGTGSACSSRNRYSRVLAACGYREDVLDGVLRVSFCPEDGERDAKGLAEKMNESAEKLKRIMRR